MDQVFERSLSPLEAVKMLMNRKFEMIYGKRIRLRGVERSDVPKFYEWINDPEVNEGLDVHLPMSMQDEEQWFEQSAQRDQAEKPMAIEMREGNDWKLIGNCGIFNLEWITTAPPNLEL